MVDGGQQQSDDGCIWLDGGFGWLDGGGHRNQCHDRMTTTPARPGARGLAFATVHTIEVATANTFAFPQYTVY